jgi:SsrA-binding protein
MKVVATNKEAYHNYFIIETFETGINLIGCEVKSIRNGEVNLKDSYASVYDGELFLRNAYIKNYDKGSFSNMESRRDRKLLMHKKEIAKLQSKSQEKGFSVVPLKIYFKGSLVKVEVAFAKGKHTYDKRETIKRKDLERETARAVRDAFKK